MKREKGYQYLGNDFWGLVATRKVYRTAQLLYIYLRGRYCRFGPEFHWADAEIRKHLGITQQTLRNAKKYLQERGLILYKSGAGGRLTRYSMLASVLLPNKSQVVKITTSSGENHHAKCRKSSPSIYKVKDIVKKELEVSHKRARFKKYNPNSKASLKAKKMLVEALK